LDDLVQARLKGEFMKVEPARVEYMDVSPLQLVSVAAGLIPFLEHDDANRALMGSNMQRQAVPLLTTEVPWVATGLEYRAAKDSGVVVVARRSGTVTYTEANEIVVGDEVYPLKKFIRSNAGTTVNQRPLVKKGDKVKAGQVIADGMATRAGELSLGRNVLVAFMPWEGYNFEDAILISQRLVKEDAYTSLHIEEFEIGARDTKLGKEEVTRDIPNVGEDALKNLGEDGIVPAARPGQILVDHSTVGPSTSRRIAEAAEAIGASFLDAPISGGVERAANGTLTIMVGGDQGAFERAHPVFEAFGANIRHVGISGAGSVVKLVNQLLCGVHSQVAAEALLLGVRGGADPRVLLEILGTSWGTSFMLSRNGPVMVERDFANARAPLRLYVKDLHLIREFAREIGSPAPLGDLTTEIFQEASNKGMGELDVSCLVLPLEERARAQVSKSGSQARPVAGEL